MDGCLEFDGARYPDGRASDAGQLRWMEGFPPPEHRRVGPGGAPMLGFPQIRWSLSHMRQLVRTVNVWRGPEPCAALPRAQAELDFGQLRFNDLHGHERSWDDALHDTYTDGILVLHRGRVVHERYLGILRPELPHAGFSLTKSYVCTIAATLVHEGLLDTAQTVPHWLPELRGTAFEDATLRQVMDMQVGVRYSEAYADPDADIWAYARVGGLLPRAPGDAGPASLYDYLATLHKEGGHGDAFAYKTVNTEVLGWIVQRATGTALPRLLSDRLWAPLGCEQDADLLVDAQGIAAAGVGLSATLRDLARFGELMRREGDWHGRQLVPAAVVADIRQGGDRSRFAKAGYGLLEGYSYRSMWWVSHNELDAFEARGIHGQRLYVAPKAEMVVARFGSHPVATSAANDPITLPQMLALGRLLQG